MADFLSGEGIDTLLKTFLVFLFLVFILFFLFSFGTGGGCWCFCLLTCLLPTRLRPLIFGPPSFWNETHDAYD